MTLVGNHGEGINKEGDVQMTPGLGLAKNMTIDHRFSERGKIRRLLGAGNANLFRRVATA